MSVSILAGSVKGQACAASSAVGLRLQELETVGFHQRRQITGHGFYQVCCPRSPETRTCYYCAWQAMDRCFLLRTAPPPHPQDQRATASFIICIRCCNLTLGILSQSSCSTAPEGLQECSSKVQSGSSHCPSSVSQNASKFAWWC